MILQDTAQAPSQFAERFRATFGDVFGEFVPQMLAALAIVFIGYLVAKIAERIVDRLLRKIGLNRILDRGGVLEAVERSGARVNPTRLLSNLVFWLLMFAVILAAANIMGLESVASVFTTLVAYIPRVIAAVVIILVGIVLGQFVGGLIAASTGALSGGRAMARMGTAGVIVLSVFMALQELGIATEIVTTAFAILFGAVALAIAIAFGLGNRDLAGEITRSWYDQYQRERRESEAHAAHDEDDDEDTGESAMQPPAGGGPTR
jgi:hypothetical protein